MRKIGILFLSFAAAVFFLAIAAGCSSDTSTRDTGDGTGSLSLYLADAPAQNYLAVYVTIKEVQVHTPDNGRGRGGWKTVGEPGKTYDLLELVNGVVAKLGETELDAGEYSQLRMILADEHDEHDGGENILGNEHPYPNYFIDDTGAKALKVPSGSETGIKLVSGFTIYDGENTELILDFDAHRSIVKAGRSGKYLLKPTIKVVEVYESAIVEGIVRDDSQNRLADTLVSAQVYDADSEPVTVFTATRTDIDGGYKMRLPPDDYAIVAYKGTTEPGATVYGPECRWLEAGYGHYTGENFTLEAVVSRALSIDLEDIFGDVPADAVISIRALQAITCDDMNVTIEVASLFLQDQEEDVIMVLPAGEYTIRAATGEKVWEKTVNVEANEPESIKFLSDHAK